MRGNLRKSLLRTMPIRKERGNNGKNLDKEMVAKKKG